MGPVTRISQDASQQNCPSARDPANPTHSFSPMILVSFRDVGYGDPVQVFSRTKTKTKTRCGSPRPVELRASVGQMAEVTFFAKLRMTAKTLSPRELRPASDSRRVLRLWGQHSCGLRCLFLLALRTALRNGFQLQARSALRRLFSSGAKVKADCCNSSTRGEGDKASCYGDLVVRENCGKIHTCFRSGLEGVTS